MNDSSFEAMRSAWLRDNIDPQALANRLAARRRRLAYETQLSAAGAFAVAALFATFAWLAVLRREAMFSLAALAFLAALPLLVSGYLKTRREAVRHDTDPSGHLAALRAGAAFELRMLAGARGCSAILGVATLGAGAMTLAGWTSTAAIWPTLAWALTAILVWIWQAMRGAQLRREIATLDCLTEQYRSTDTA